MTITKVKCWFVPDAIYDINQVEAQAPTLELIKKSILKTGYRAFGLNDRPQIEKSEWYSSYLLNDKVFFYIEGSGIYKLVNLDLIENEFYFEKSNLPAGYRPWIFYSWQSDHNPSRTHIREGIDAAIEAINARNPKAEIEIVESTRPEDGAENIVDAIRNNIDRSLFCVFDVTNVSSIDAQDPNSKSYPNANVVFELGYSLSKKNMNQVVIVKKARTGDFANDHPPFDFAQNRRVEYTQAANGRNRVRDIIVQYFEQIDFID
jgi:hypothetical protein